MTYEVVYVEEILDDFEEMRLDDKDVIDIRQRVDAVAKHQNPLLVTERVFNTPLRKLGIGSNRLFLHIDAGQHVIYCLAYKRHNVCYKQQHINRVLTLVSKMQGKS
jgi:mRNA-degrading endonuclease RelE of RelBE toxin-antitoxin system